MMNLAASRMSFMAVFLGYPRSHSPLCSLTSRRICSKPTSPNSLCFLNKLLMAWVINLFKHRLSFQN